ncbi:COMM domain-containing 1-like [Paramuricea clavata]|uniref:COMM domain-containing protein 1 n=1 Tax=Paramuricea clavata TaxID=317549 RepID=A0A6S7FYT6_PARCT|nr:COMM domain-containing 1-like [Paramuricea clavata]
MAAADKNFVGLLNGLARRTYFAEEDITNEFLKQELFPDLPQEEFDALLKKCDALMKNIVVADMDFNQLEAFLTSQRKKRQGAITEGQSAAIVKFWKSQKSKIHDILVDKSRWNNKLKDLSWRIDFKSQARHVSQLNTPVAIVEMKFQNPRNEENVDTMHFEMDEKQLTNVLQSIGDIEKLVEAYGK